MWIRREHEPVEELVAPGASVLVPTMGALHEGHLALIRQGVRHAEARGLSGGCIVSVFVNPTQFDDPADFERYARTLDDDIERCRASGAAGVFAPSVEAVYPPGEPTPVSELPPQAVEKGLEEAHRPGHFEGVCQVVRRLFDLVRPAAAVFGEKDWQQLQVVRAMTDRDQLGVEILAGPTVREPDGLALSSRNRFLDGEGRQRALALSRSLAAARDGTTPPEGETAMRRVLAEAGIDRPDYASIRDAASLDAPEPGRPARALVAARVGTVRLLDNAPWP
jgi:pantoate--beta-alanine ligase